MAVAIPLFGTIRPTYSSRQSQLSVWGAANGKSRVSTPMRMIVTSGKVHGAVWATESRIISLAAVTVAPANVGSRVSRPARRPSGRSHGRRSKIRVHSSRADAYVIQSSPRLTTTGNPARSTHVTIENDM